MKKYEASDELINIFLKHGFTEKTSKLYPKHAQLLEDRGVYDPQIMKRLLVHKRDYDYILFDYINIKIIEHGSRHQLHFLSLTEQELHSILTFFSLASKDRWDLNKKYALRINELHLFYNDCIERQKVVKPTMLQQRVIKAFEETTIEG